MDIGTYYTTEHGTYQNDIEIQKPIPCVKKPKTYSDKPCPDAEEKIPDARNLVESVEVS